MSVLSLLSRLKESGINLQLVDEHLRLNAPEEKLTPALINELKDKKEEITAFLRRNIQKRVKYSSIRPAEKKEYYVLSSAQRRMYILQQMLPSNVSYNLPHVMPLGKEVDKKKLEETFKRLIVRHESLRTSFEMVYGEPVQKVWDPGTIEFAIEYYRLDPSLGIQEETVIEDFVKPFDMSHAPLLRVGLLNTGKEGEEHILLLDVHHIVTDGTSQQVLFQEFMTLFKGRQLVPLSLQYKDYAEWRNREGVKEALKDQESYWLQEFRGEIPVLNLPTDFSRPAVQSFEGSELEFVLSREETRALNEVARLEEATIFMVLLSVYYIFLFKLTGQENIVVGSPLASRNHNDLQQIIGMFVNTLALRNFPTPGKTFKNFLEEVKGRTLKAFENQDYQFEDLVENAAVERDMSRNPLFDAMFVLQNIFDTSSPEKLSEQDIVNNYKNKTSKFDLSLIAVEGVSRLHFTFEYCTKLFKEETVTRFVHYFKKIISAVVGNPELEISGITIITEEEKKRILVEFNDTNAAFPGDKTIHQLFEEQAERTGDSIAVIGTVTTSITYKQLNEKSGQLAQMLGEKGVKPGDIVGIMVERSIEMIVGIFGILKAGAAYLPIDPDYPDKRKRFMLADSAANLLLTSRDNIPVGAGGLAPLYLPIEDRLAANPEKQLATSSENLAYVIYTSGTTGKPKGVAIEHCSLVNRLNWMQKKYPITGSDVILQKTPFTFDVSVWEIFWWAIKGARVCLLIPGGEKDPEEIVKTIEMSDISLMHFVPSMLNAFMDYVKTTGEIERLSSLGQVFASGEALTLQQVKDFNQLFYKRNGTKLANLYGPTEATVDVSYFDCSTDEDFNEIPIGKPIQNIQLFILNKHNQFQPIGVAGELCISGRGLARGYLNRPQLTAEKFDQDFQDYQDEKGPAAQESSRAVSKAYYPTHPLNHSPIYRTGDLARWMPDGNIQFLGRMDHQVKMRGFRIELGEIESQLVNHREVNQAVVTAKKDQKGDTYLCAYVVGQMTLNQNNLGMQLREYLSHTLPDYMIPSFFISLEQLPLTPNGKIDRNALPDPEINGIDENSRTYVAPRNELEAKLVNIWSEVLGIKKDIIGIDSNFFELGGHSLKATILISRIHKDLHVKVPLVEVFKRAQIRRLAEYVEKAIPNIYREIIPVEKKDYYPQSAAQKRLFFLDKFEHISTSYNMPVMLIIKGKIQKERFENAVKALIARHETLRTSFDLIGNEAVQRIHQRVEFKMEEIALNCEDEVHDQVNRFIRSFDLSKAPLLRMKLVALSKDKYLLLFDMHHIVSDGTSGGILIDEFCNLYAGDQLPPLKIQYRDFSSWQTNLFKIGKIKEQKEYWLNLFSDAHDIPKLVLPTDFPRPPVFVFEGDEYSFYLNTHDSDRFKEVCERHGVTLFMNLLAVFNVLLFKYTGQEDITIGCDIAGRPHVDLQPIIGMFVNELAMRNYPNGGKIYTQFLEEVRENSIDAFENQDYQFEELVDQLNLERDPSRNPLFDVEFAFQNYEQSTAEIKTLSVEPYEYRNKAAQFDLALDAYEVAGQIQFRLHYCTRLFKKRTIKALAGHFLNILREVTQNSGIPLSDIEMITPQEKKQILFEFNNVKKDIVKDKCYSQLFQQQVEKTPDRTAVKYKDESLSHLHLDEKSSQLANYLYYEKDIRPNDRLGIWMDRSINFLIAILGIMKAGAAYVPIDPFLPEDRIKRIINDAGIGVVISQAKYTRNLDRLQWECPSFHTYINIDTSASTDDDDQSLTDSGKEEVKSAEELWNYIVDTAVDEIAEGGWFTSYTGQPFTKEEMDEYGDNALKKLMPLLHPKMRVLEIGCSSGITMYRIAPRVGFYYGTDISRVTIQKNRQRLKQNQYRNIHLQCLPAHDIDTIGESDFDLIIINSVIQSFQDHRYLRNVLRKAMKLSAKNACWFIGDVMDQKQKQHLIQEMIDFKKANKEKNYKTKIDWSTELFVSREFFEDLAMDFPQIKKVDFSDKIYTLENELTKFRYDTILTIDKTSNSHKSHPHRKKHKYQHDLNALHPFDSKEITPPSPPSTSDDFAYVIYTSGTTGQPKGVLIHQLGMINHIYAKINDLSITGEDIIAQTASASFDISVWQFLAGLLVGASTVIIDKETVLDSMQFLNVLQREKITLLESVPSLMTVFLEMIKSGKDNELNSLRYMIPTGEALTVPLVREWYQLYPEIKLVNAYGPTEASDDVTHYFVYDVPLEDQPTIPIGKPLQNLHIYILDKNLSLCPVGVRGEICVAGIGVGKGYWKDEKKTQKAFIPNPFLEDIQDNDYATVYKTGDIGYFREDGNVECLGRIDFQVKIRGNRIELAEIENQLVKHEDIKEAIVTLIQKEGENTDPNEKANKYICAYYVPGKEIDESDLRDYLLKELPDYMIPSYFIQLEKIPLSSSGKVDRKALPAPGARASGEEYIAPRDEVEKKLAEIWSGVLGIDRDMISIGSNFFELGGHSLNATVVVSKVHKELNVKLPIAEIFNTPTISGLAQYIKGVVEDKFNEIEPAEEKDYYVLFSAQKRMYILHQMDNKSIRFNMPMVLRLDGPFDKIKVENILKKLIRRHECFRMSFEMKENEPIMRIHPTVEFELEYVDLTDSSARTPEGKKETEIVNTFLRYFDLSRPPLLRVGLIKLATEKYILMADMHHIISDGTSAQIFEEEFQALYAGTELPELKLRYRDFSEWQNHLSTSSGFKKQKEYWINRFKGDIPELKMPLDYPRPVSFNADGTNISFEIDREITSRIKQLALETETTLFMVLMAVFTILLAKYSKQEDIVMGTPIAGRRYPDLENMVGLFINMLAIRNLPEGEKTFREFLEEVKINALNAYENQDYQFDDLVLDLNLKMDGGRNPLFNAVFVLQNEIVQEIKIDHPEELSKINVLPYEIELEKVHHELLLNANEVNGSLAMSLEYSTQLYKETTAQKMAKHYVEILEQVLENNEDILIQDIMISHELIAASPDITLREQGDFRI